MSSRLPVLMRATRPEVPGDSVWQKIWLAAQRSDWRSLAIVSGGKGYSTVGVAQMLLRVGWQHRGLPMGLADLCDVPLSHIDSAISQVKSHVDDGDRVLIALGSIFDNPTTVALAQAADRALLCVVLGVTEMSGAEQTVEEIGKDRFIGTVVLHPDETGGLLLPGAPR
jgi:hypothetical protein